MKIVEQKQSRISEHDRARIPEYEWDRLTRTARSGFCPFLAGTAWRDLTRNEREHIYCESEFLWEESKSDAAPIRYRIKITAVRFSHDAMREIGRASCRERV